MTWAFAKFCKWFAIGMNLRNSLKILKGMSSNSKKSIHTLSTISSSTTTNTSTISSSTTSFTSSSSPSSTTSSSVNIILEDTSSIINSSLPTSTSPPSLCLTSTGKSILMFWSIFALIIIWEQYFEYFISWFPLYYYIKSIFILLMAFPKLKFINTVFYSYLIPFFEWIHNHYENIMEYDWKMLLYQLPFDLIFLFFPFHIPVNSGRQKKDNEEVKYEKEKIERSGNDEMEIIIVEENVVDLSIALYEEEEKEEKTVEKIEYQERKRKEAEEERRESNEERKLHEKVKEIKAFVVNGDEEKDEEDTGVENITFRTKYSTPKSSSRRVSNSSNKEDSMSPGNTSTPEKVSPMLTSVRQVCIFLSSSSLITCSQLLTGDARSKLRDSVFNFDVFSPNPNTLYRQRHSIIPSHSPDTNTNSVPTQSMKKTPVARDSTGSTSVAESTLGSSSIHRVIRTTLNSKLSDRRDDCNKKSTRGVRTKYQIDFDSDDITSPLHFPSSTTSSDQSRGRVSPSSSSSSRRSDGKSSQYDAKPSRLPYHESSKPSRLQSTRRAGTPDRNPRHASPLASSLPPTADSKSRYPLRSSTHKTAKSEIDLPHSHDLLSDSTFSDKKTENTKRRPISMRVPNPSSSSSSSLSSSFNNNSRK